MTRGYLETEFTYLPKGELFNHIQPGLFMGGTADDDVCYGSAGQKAPEFNDSFECVVTLYSHAKPVYWGIEEMRYGFMDSSIQDIDLERLGDVVVWAYKKWQGGNRVLIRCQAGLNRSGLVSALVLMYKGATANEAVRMIRLTRGANALFNKQYVAWLRKHGARYITMVRNRELGISFDREELDDLFAIDFSSDFEVR